MVSDQEIASCVESLLRSAAAGGGGAGAGEASFTAVVQQAEAKLGVDLSHKASFIRDQMDLFFGPRLQSPPPKIPTAPASAPGPAALTPQPVPQQMAQLSTLQPHLIFQTVQQLPATAVSAPPAVPAMAFYPPPPLAFRYSTAMGGANAGAISFQQPATGTVATTTASATTAAQAGSDTKESSSKRKRGGPGGLNKVCGISPELQTIVGETVMSRTQIVKQLWAYIRKNNLQDPDDKRKIICNDELRVVFGTDTTDMFKMNKLLAKHITPIDPKDQIREVKKVKAPSVVPQSRPHVSQPSVVISDALAKFIGTEGTVLQDDALKYLWDYIKANQLEDVMNSSILCDSRLRELFGCESIPISGLSELLSHHFIKKT